jgi:hypothetical protein
VRARPAPLGITSTSGVSSGRTLAILQALRDQQGLPRRWRDALVAVQCGRM